jgi:hypothetical protein
MKCKKTAITVATILLITFQAFCQSAEQLAAQAAKEYNSMHFGEAIKLYGKIVDNGFESSSFVL